MISFWPDMSLPTDTKGRVGRMLFWVFTIIAAPFAAGMWWGAIAGGDERWIQMAICGVGAAFFYGIGRGLIYILDDE